ncbi:MAG: ribbon-helix-helix protein, CopG family [Longimicrobiales bacterium]|nr:ribbon-helix-helix protein, CopG family [Longimicrobiales bacterium]
MAIPYHMARMTIRSTFALDPGTAQALERLAARWGVSKSEALRRAVAFASREEGVDPAAEALAALDLLQERMGMEDTTAAEWIQTVRAERRAGRP